MMRFLCDECRRKRYEAYPNWDHLDLGERLLILATEAVEDDCPNCQYTRRPDGTRG